MQLLASRLPPTSGDLVSLLTRQVDGSFDGNDRLKLDV